MLTPEERQLLEDVDRVVARVLQIIPDLAANPLYASVQDAAVTLQGAIALIALAREDDA